MTTPRLTPTTRKSGLAGSASVAVWTVFLVIPLILIATVSTASMPWRVVGVIATLAFGAEFVRFMVKTDEVGMPSGSRVPGERWRAIAIEVAILGALAAATVPALGPPAIFIPYFASIGLFMLPPVAGIVWAAVLLVGGISTAVPFLGENAMLQLGGPLVATLMVIAVRVVMGAQQSAGMARSELMAVQEREAISRDVHDILGHSLTVVSLKSQLARRLLRVDPDRAEAELDEVIKLTAAALDDVRATVGQLKTPDLAAQLDAARSALETAGIDVTIKGSWGDLTPDRRALAAWLVRETTTNVLRHSGATRCDITIGSKYMSIIDDGVGWAGGEGHGITGLRRRMADSGARLAIGQVRPGAERPGTRVEVTLA